MNTNTTWWTNRTQTTHGKAAVAAVASIIDDDEIARQFNCLARSTKQARPDAAAILAATIAVGYGADEPTAVAAADKAEATALAAVVLQELLSKKQMVVTTAATAATLLGAAAAGTVAAPTTAGYVLGGTVALVREADYKRLRSIGWEATKTAAGVYGINTLVPITRLRTWRKAMRLVGAATPVFTTRTALATYIAAEIERDLAHAGYTDPTAVGWRFWRPKLSDAPLVGHPAESPEPATPDPESTPAPAPAATGFRRLLRRKG